MYPTWQVLWWSHGVWRIANIGFVQQGELSQEITELGKEVKNIKLTQDAQIKAFKNGAKEDAKVEITQLVGYVTWHDTWLRPTLTGFMMFDAQRED